MNPPCVGTHAAHAAKRRRAGLEAESNVVTRAALLREGSEACREQSKSSAGLRGSIDVQRCKDIS